MAEPYIEAITAERALRLSEEEALRGEVLVSAETQTELADDDLTSWIMSNPLLLFQLLRELDPRHQDMFLGYHLLGQSQTMLGKIHGTTQSELSKYIREAAQTICAIALVDAVMPSLPVVPEHYERETEYRRDGDITGQFRIRCDDADFGQLYTSRAREYGTHQ